MDQFFKKNSWVPYTHKYIQFTFPTNYETYETP